MATPHFALPDPDANQAYIEVSALEAGLLQLIHTRFIAGSQPGESTMCPWLTRLVVVGEIRSVFMTTDIGSAIQSLIPQVWNITYQT